jgi:ubiquinone/menaquinone biosynthesis C-methylase UbiE
MASHKLSCAGDSNGKRFREPTPAQTRRVIARRFPQPTIHKPPAALTRLMRSKAVELDKLSREEEAHNRELERKITKFLKNLTHQQVVTMCFNHWSVNYDEEMEGHTKVILRLLASLRALEKIEYWAKNPIFGKKLLALSIGTAAIEHGLISILGPEFCSEMHVHGNDLSDQMMAIALERMNDTFGSLRFTSDEIAKLRLHSEYDTTIISQTLEFLPDKIGAMSKFLSSLGNLGAGIVLSEYPQKLSVDSMSSNIPKRILFGSMGYFRPISIGELRQVHLGNSVNTRVEVQLKLPIDISHDMYVLLARKVGNDLQSTYPTRQAIEMLFNAILEMQEVEPWARPSHQIITGKIREYCPKEEILKRKQRRKKRKVGNIVSHLKHTYDQRTHGSEGTYAVMELDHRKIQHHEYGSYGATKHTVILNSIIQQIPPEEDSYGKLCRFVKPGQHLIILDRFPPSQETIQSNHGKTVQRRTVKSLLARIGFDDIAELWIPIDQKAGACAMVFKKQEKD